MSVKVTPKIDRNDSTRLGINDLDQGEFFLYDGNLYQVDGESGLCISDVTKETIYCGGEDYDVIPVDVEIKWSYPKKGKK